MSLKLHNIHKDYGSFSLDIPELSIDRNRFFGIVGESGCGKTTLLRTIAGLIKQDRGRIIISDKDVTSLSPENRDIGMVFQEPRLFPYMNVLENLSFGLKMRGASKRERFERSVELLPQLNLEGKEQFYPSELSGGQQQRVAIGRALIYKPSIILMDEPLSALDPNLRTEMRRFLKKLHRENDTTILFVSHDRDEAFELFDDMIYMEDGKIIERGSPRRLYERPTEKKTAIFMGVENIVSARRQGNQLKIGDMTIPNAGPDCDGWILMRPETFTIDKDGAYGTVLTVDYRRGETWIDLKLGEITLKIKSPYRKDLQQGQKLRVSVDQENICFIERN